MKKMIFASLCLVAMMASCDGKKQNMIPESQVAHERDSLMQAISQRDAELDEMMTMVNDINTGFQQINAAQGRVVSEKAEGGNMRSQIQDNMNFIQQTMQQNREQIEKLKARLKNSSLASTKLQETIDQLTAQLEEKNAQLEALRAELANKDITIQEQGQQIENLNANVSDLNALNEEKAAMMAQQDKQLNTAWFVFGTKAELKEQKILEKGDVLKNGNYNKEYFTQIDIRTYKEIKLYSKSASMLTNHPAGSYTLEKDSKGQYVLKITDPNKFWSVSRYLVIQVK